MTTPLVLQVPDLTSFLLYCVRRCRGGPQTVNMRLR